MVREQAINPAASGQPMRALARTAAWLGLVAWAGAWPAVAMAQVGVVVRCPGPPVLYTDALSAEEARSRGCRGIDGAPITVVQAPRARPAAPAPAGAAPVPSASGSRPPETKVDASAQRQRDSDARRILEAELRREEDKLAGLKREFNNGEPERRGEERNYQTYLDRVAQMRAAVARTESDIASIKRELGKLN